jgi:hypothetical protein
MVIYKVGIFIKIRNPRLSPPQYLVFSVVSPQKMNTSFFLEATNDNQVSDTGSWWASGL